MTVPPGWPARVVLASSSPRRLDLLRSIGIEPEVRPAHLDESELPGEDPRTYVRRLAIAKGLAVAGPGEVVVAADTTVDVDGAIVGKPADAVDAARLLRLLSGRTHLVHTGIAVARGGDVTAAVVTSEVTFVGLHAEVVDWYIATGEPLDKAGAYGLQGPGAMLVASVRGSTTNVIGLPLAELHRLVRGEVVP
jgi:septum formation protein